MAGLTSLLMLLLSSPPSDWQVPDELFYIPLRSLQAARGRDDPELQIPLLLFKAANPGLRPCTSVRLSVCLSLCLSVSLPHSLGNGLFQKFSSKAAPSLLCGVPQGPSSFNFQSPWDYRQLLVYSCHLSSNSISFLLLESQSGQVLSGGRLLESLLSFTCSLGWCTYLNQQQPPIR